MKRLVSSVGLSLLMVSTGCAKKKELPPRGNLIGSAQFSPQLEFELQSSLEIDGKILDLKDHCLQMVEHSDGQRVVEMSGSACPASGLVDGRNIVASMKVYSEVEPGESTYLVMGNSPVLDQNTDVAILKNVSGADSKTPLYQIESLCQDTEREELSKNCSIEWSDSEGSESASIKSIRYKKSRPANLVRRHQIHELYSADEAIRSDMAAMDTRLSNQIEEVRSTLDAKVDKMDARLKAEDKRIETKLDEAVSKLQAVDSELKKEDVRLDSAIKTVRTDLVEAINTETTNRMNEDGKLAKSITDLTATLNAFKKEQGETNADLSKKIASNLVDLETNITRLGDELSKSNKAINQNIENLQKELVRIEALEKNSKEIADAITELKKQIRRIKALKKKDEILQKMIGDLETRVKALTPPPEKPEEEAALPENSNTESPKP